MHYYGYGAYPMGYHMAGFGLFGVILAVLFWVLVIWLIISFVRWIAGGHEHHHWHWRDRMESGSSSIKSEPEHIRILKERYAKGEINKEEFEQKKKDLEV